MSMSNTAEAALLAHYFNNAAVANVGDASGLPRCGCALFPPEHKRPRPQTCGP